MATGTRVTKGGKAEDTNGDALLDEFKKFLESKRGES